MDIPPVVGLKQQLLWIGFEVEPIREVLSAKLSEFGVLLGEGVLCLDGWSR
jgi:hypothetical protein